MKRLFLSLLVGIFIVLTTNNISASGKTDDFFIKESFVKNVQEALLEDHKALTARMSHFIKVIRDKNIPNCFECSLYLIRETLNSDGETQLVAADLAVKFSPDLPEGHLHLLMRLLKFSPLSGGRILKSTQGTLKTFFHFPPRDAFFYSILSRISKGCIIFLLIFFLLVFFKYPSALIHRYMHLVGFSRFYAFALLLAVGAASVVFVTNEFSWIIVLMTGTMFFSGVAVIREKIVMHTVLIVCLFAEAVMILTGVNESFSVDKETALRNFKAVYSPASI
ncbi:MAG TPA: hypothetical protein ENN58_00865, partial [bacterium]|nr:hypothetical protein [bacterium]